MKKNFIISLILILGVLRTYAQEEVAKINLADLDGGSLKSMNYSAGNYDNDHIVTLLTSKGKMRAHLFDSNFNELKSPITRKLNNGGLNKLVGHKIQGNTYSFIYSNNIRNAFVAFSFNFDTGKSTKHVIDFSFKGERVVEAFSSFQNRFFIFSVSLDGKFILRELDDTAQNIIKIANYQLTNKTIGKKIIRYRDHFLYSKAYYTMINDKEPASIVTALYRFKLFNQDNSLILTCENREYGTSMYTVDLETLEFKDYFLPYPKGKIKDYQHFNSFVSNNHVFQIANSERELTLQIKTSDNTIIKEYYATKSDSLNFKNTVIKQEGRTSLPFQKKRRFDGTAKFLRRMNDGQVGVSVQHKEDKYEVIIGGTRESVTGFLLTGTGNTQTYQITSLLDKNFNHIPEPIEMNTFDRISAYEGELKKNDNPTIFFDEGFLYYSYIDKKNKMLHFVRF